MADGLEITAIPHRPPFLFVDEIIEVDEGRILTRLFVDPASDFFRGHYPHRPVMPGVLICESCFQAGALLIAHILRNHDPLGPDTTEPRASARAASAGQDRASPELLPEDAKNIPVLTRISEARFKRMVGPGQTMHIEVTLDEELNGAYFMTGRVTVDDKPVLRVKFACTLAQDKDEPS